MEMPDHPDATQKSLGRLWPNSSNSSVHGNTERVTDVVMASSDDHADEVEAYVGHSMKLSGKGGTTEVPKRGGTTKLPEKGAH